MAEQTVVVNELRYYLGIFHKRRSLIVTCLAMSLLGATLYNYSVRPVYQATAQILVDRRAQNVLATGADRIDAAELTDLATQLELLRGQVVAEKVVDKLQLHKTAEFQTGPMMSIWERFQRRFLGRTPPAPVDSSGIPLSPAAAAFRSRLVLEPVPGSRLVNVRFRAYDPRIAQEAVNALAQVFIEQTVDIRHSNSSEASGWFGERLKEQEERVKAAERALQQYREREKIAAGEDRGELVNQKLVTISNALTQARMERVQKEATLAQVRTTSPSQWENIPLIQANLSVQSLRAKLAELRRDESRLSETLGDKHPDMQKVRSEIKATEAKIMVEVQGAIQALEGAVVAARQQEASLEESLGATKKEGLELGTKAVEYQILKREVDSHQSLFQDLMNKTKAAGLETELRATNVRIVEKAGYPKAPFAPQRARNYQLALLIGLGLGLGLTILFEHLDNSVKTPEDVKHELGLPFLGMVPQVEVRAGASTVQKLMNENPQSTVAEAYRLLRTNLLFCSPDAAGMVVVVSSANPGEGKTTTVANLAASLAQNGAKVLAIDADLRRPTLHQHFGTHKTPGLSDLIVGKCQASEAVQVTRFKGLHVLPCGYIPPNPAELLGSQNMRSALAAFRKHYEWVLIDTAPILAMADTPVVCPHTDGLVLVVAAEATTRAAIQRSTDQVHGVGGKLVGVVLNKVNLQRNSYYYNQYYGPYYRSYYGEGTREKPRPKAIKRA
jgi:capsular exopolysaccharide synthesis family protein